MEASQFLKTKVSDNLETKYFVDKKKTQTKLVAPSKPVFDAFKRLFDFIFASIFVVLLLPIFAIIAIAIKIDSKGPVFYRCRRMGKNNKVFLAWKFRSMIQNAEEFLNENPDLKKKFEENVKLKDDPRITRVGKILRKTSFDEFPQLFNVIKGEMSLVGPRPKLVDEIYRYGKYRNLVLSVLPGMTGYWQVNGRCNTTYEERIPMDIYYVMNRSFWLDIKILIKTIPAMLDGE